MCQKESWGAIFGTTEAHSTQRDQPPRMHGPGLWMYEQKEQRVTPVRMIGVNCIFFILRHTFISKASNLVMSSFLIVLISAQYKVTFQISVFTILFLRYLHSSQSSPW